MLKRSLAIIAGIFIPVICSAQSVVYFPQVVDGITGNSGWISAIAVANSGTATASGAITFTQDDGTPFNIVMRDQLKNPVGNGNTVPFQIPPGQTRFFISHAKQPVTSGFATVTSNVPVVAGLIFEEYSVDATGAATLTSEAGVPAVNGSTQQKVIAVNDKSDSGIAVANVGTSTAIIMFQLVDVNGNQALPTVNRMVGPKNHTAFLLSQLFPNAPVPFYGLLQITSTSPIVVTSLIVETSGLFATLPIVQ
jgi:hypothetical protein